MFLVKNNWRDEKGVIGPFVAVMLVGFIAFIGAAVDLGMIYSARSQLQTAADSAALGAARNLLTEVNGMAAANYDGAETTAINLVQANPFLGANLIWGGDDSYEAGLWDLDAADFTSTGFTSDPEELNAVRVTLERNVDTLFAKIVGVSTVKLTVKATGFLGCAGNGTKADLPLVVHDTALATPGDELVFNNENDENIQWTSFFTWPCNTNTIGDYLDDPASIPELNLGDDVSMNNGVIDTTLRDLDDLFNANQQDGEWRVILPVVDWTPPQNHGVVVGFVQFAITAVDDHGADKGLTGYWPDNGQLIAPSGSSIGANCFGVRASSATLLQ